MTSESAWRPASGLFELAQELPQERGQGPQVFTAQPGEQPFFLFGIGGHDRVDQFRRYLADMRPEREWSDVRTLAMRASTATGSENISWHSLVLREKDDII